MNPPPGSTFMRTRFGNGRKNVLSSCANRAWRLVATGLGFVFFGVFGVLLQLFLIPFLLNPSPDLASRKRARRTVTKTWLWFSHYLTAAGILSVRFEGFERLAGRGS